ncbi:MAG: 2Fe-2S iron-sulfur cluster binding domain-containing protein [Candidatus Latescibacteria bacterium]|nr:2Fe-2S iron-sulfur cluster binding domain-containing protein [Candidatus Latescibacterota bacterium]
MVAIKDLGLILQIIGLIIAILVLGQMVFGLSAFVLQRRRALKLLDVRIDQAREQVERIFADEDQNKIAQTFQWNGYRKFVVARKVFEDQAKTICSFYLVPQDRQPLAAYKPGQFLTFQLNIEEERPTIRCYSLSDSPNPNHYRITIKRLQPGLASNYFHQEVEEGDILAVKTPSGHFFLENGREKPIVLLGGGVGITPVLSMLNAQVAQQSYLETWFFYGVRNSNEHIFRDHLDHLVKKHSNLNMHICYSQPTTADLRNPYHRERISIPLLKKLLPSNNYDFYLCGPPSMMSDLYRGLQEWGVPPQDIKLEAFGSATVAPFQEEDNAIAEADITITFSKSGKECKWSSDMVSLLDLAERNDVVIESGCQNGHCNTCLTPVKGKVTYTHEPVILPEEGTCLACISKPAENLVLEA